MKWDNNGWQGRSKEQVERNNKVFGYSVIIAVVFGVILFLLTII
jgi:uncharacterized membrane protein YidH (DUF202 family)